MVWLELLRQHVRMEMLSKSARRGEALFCSPESGRWCCSARVSARHRFCDAAPLAEARSDTQVLWMHAARDRRPHPFADEVRAYRALTRGRSFVCYTRPGSSDKIVRTSTRAVTSRDRCSLRSAFHEMRMSTSAGRLDHERHETELATLSVAPEQISRRNFQWQ